MARSKRSASGSSRADGSRQPIAPTRHPVAVVNETMAKMYWKDGNPVGQRIRMGGNGERPWITVVGVVGDLQHNGLGSMVKEKFYRPHSQFAQSRGFRSGT